MICELKSVNSSSRFILFMGISLISTQVSTLDLHTGLELFQKKVDDLLCHLEPGSKVPR